MRTSPFAIAIAVSSLLVGCAAEDEIDDPADAASCEDLVDLAAERIRGVVGELGMATIEDLEAASPDDPFAPLVEPFIGFDERSGELGCIETQVAERICERLTGLESSGPVAEDFLEGYYEACG